MGDETMDWKPGDRCWVRSTWHGEKRQAHVVKVGRRWVTVDNRHEYDKATGEERHSGTSARMMFSDADLKREALEVAATMALRELELYARSAPDSVLREIVALRDSMKREEKP